MSNQNKEVQLRMAQLDYEATQFVTKSRAKLLLAGVIVPLCAFMGALAWQNEQKPEEEKKDYSLIYLMGLGTVGLARACIGFDLLASYLAKRRLKKMERDS